MRVFPAAVVIALALATRPASASCAPPSMEVEQTTVEPGAQFDVRGVGFINGCDDVGGGNACGGGDIGEEEDPMRDVRLELRFRGTLLDVETADAHEDGEIVASLDVPLDAAPGRYHIVSVYWGEPQESVPVRVESREAGDRE